MVKCPLLPPGTEMKPFGKPFVPRECIKNECALWTGEECAILLIAKAAREIVREEAEEKRRQQEHELRMKRLEAEITKITKEAEEAGSRRK